MKKWLVAFFLPVSLFCEPFTDPFSGLSLEIPENYRCLEEESNPKTENITSWWYAFSDPNQSMIMIEIDEYDHTKSLPEFFHHHLTSDENEDNDKIVYEGLEFKNFKLNEMNFTKCKVRAFAKSEKAFEPLYICDYLFVNDCYGFSIGLMKKDDTILQDADLDEMMLNILKSIHF